MKHIALSLLLALGAATSHAQSTAATPVKQDTIVQLATGEVEAEYPGGTAGWIAYLQKNLNGEAASRDVPKKAKTFTQTARVQFVVNADGTLSNIQVINDVLPSIRAEAIRVVRYSGKWNPAQQGGRFVKAYRTQPITFSFE